MLIMEAVKTIKGLPYRQSALLLGPPGTGKTAVGTYVAEDTNAFLCVRDLASHLAEDLLGVPYRDSFRDSQVTRYAPLDWLYELNDHERAVLVLDDLPAASEQVQVAVFRLLQERCVGSFKLGPNVRIIATGNRPTDQSNASTLPAALRNKVWVGNITPDINEWLEWANEHKLSSIVRNYLETNPGDLWQLPNQALASLGTFATPRSWANLADAISTPGCYASIELCQGFVGMVGERFFRHYMQAIKSIPNPSKVLEDPEGTVKEPITDADTMIALMGAVADFAASRRNKDHTVPEKFVKAIAHLTADNHEFAQTAFARYFEKGGQPKELVEILKRFKFHPKVTELVKFMQEGN